MAIGRRIGLPRNRREHHPSYLTIQVRVANVSGEDRPRHALIRFSALKRPESIRNFTGVPMQK